MEDKKTCDECGKIIKDEEWYFTDQVNMASYCSLECLGMTEEEYDEQYSEVDDCAFMTTWPGY